MWADGCRLNDADHLMRVCHRIVAKGLALLVGGALAFGASLLWSASNAAQPSSLQRLDDRGKTIRLSQPARRVVTLAPHLAELAEAAGATLVGVSAFTADSAMTRALPRVADSVRLDFERILALQPDLVLAWRSGNPPAALARLEALGLTVHVSEPQRLEDVARLLREFGMLAGDASLAEQRAQQFLQQRDALLQQQAQRSEAPMSLLVELWHQPLLLLGGQQLANDVLLLCGARNRYADQPGTTLTLSMEQVLRDDPGFILSTSRDAVAAQQFWGRHPSLRAVRQGGLVVFEDPRLFSMGPGVLQVAQSLCPRIATARQRAAMAHGAVAKP
jgi:iron complex transport system substrate-binding protein